MNKIEDIKMREIKFRAWDEYEECFLDSEEFAINFLGTVFEANLDAEVYNNLINQDSIKIMQYTGLKDKNGEEIYEYMEIDGNFEVRFKDGCYVLTNISNGDIVLLYNYLRDKNGQVTVTKEYTKI
jgi:hypothetical protein